jgi:predicted nucleic acid-binding protein
MSVFYLDTSAIVKRYFIEIGSAWIKALTDPAAGYTLIVSAITRVEAAAACAAKHRAPGGITRAERDQAVSLLLKHCDTEYQIAPVSSTIISRAVTLTQNYRLRGYDAVQLATALVINEQYVAAGLPILTLISADNDMLAAASSEGLATDNPNTHP